MIYIQGRGAFIREQGDPIWRQCIPDERELQDCFRAHGFTPSGRRAQYFLPMVLHRALRSRGLSAALESPFRLTGLTGLLGSPVIARFTREAASR